MATMTEGEYRYNQLIKTFASEPSPGFETPAQQETVWARRGGCNSDVGRLRVVLMHRPGDELNIVDPAKRIEHLGAYGDEATGWYWRGREIPDLATQQAQHDALVAALREEGVEVVFLDRCAPGRMKSIYTRDQVVGVDGGAIICRMGARIRRGEEAPATEAVAKLGMPILRTIHGEGIMEGGSFAFITPKIAVVGISSRVNEEAARQIEESLRVQGVELLRVHLTGYRLHIDGAFVMIDVATAIINPVQLPFWFLQKLKELKINCIEVHPDDPAWTVNCLAVAPGRVLMADKVSPRTAEAMDKAGISVRIVPYEAVYQGGGGIHCSTAPLVREPI